MKKFWIFTILCLLVIPSFDNLEAKKVKYKKPDLSKYDYPRLANLYLKTPITDDEAEQLAQWDLVVLGMQAQDTSPEKIRKMRKLNPDIKILAYVASQEFPEKNYVNIESKNGPWHKLYEGITDDMWLYKSNGNRFSSWPGNYSMNVTNSSSWNTYLPTFMHNQVMSTGLWDGIYYDNVWETVSWVGDGNMDTNQDGKKDSAQTLDDKWFKGMKKMLKKSRKLEGKNAIIMGNGGNGYKKYLNGRLFESFPDLWPGIWDENFEKYYNFEENGYMPTLNIINAGTKNSGNYKDYKDVRFGIATTLLDNGFFSYDWGTQDHSQLWWYDEYEVALGKPVSSAYNLLNSDHPSKIQAGLWRRDFEQGIVFVNSTNKKRSVTLETGYEKINGTQGKVNDGVKIGKVTIPAKDGIILLGTLAQITEVPFVNGGYSKVFNKKGKMTRNSFFSYDDDFAGSQQIVKLPDVNKTVVAGDTYVEVYRGKKRIAKFAPYGESFTGGVNIAVNKLYKNNNKYYIVTGTQNYGPQVRIFNIKGKLKNPGCFPYQGPGFQGGINVGTGDLNGDGRMEIVVGAGFGGGPHIRVLNNKCQVINPGFFAYDKSARFGVNIGVGDLTGDGKAEIVTGPGPGGAPHVRIFNRNGKITNNGFYAYDKNDHSGILVGVADIDGNGINEIVTSSFGIHN